MFDAYVVIDLQARSPSAPLNTIWALFDRNHAMRLDLLDAVPRLGYLLLTSIRLLGAHWLHWFK